MSAVLRASGRNFDVDAFVAKSKLHFIAIYHRGEPRFPRSQPRGRKFTESGLNLLVSNADFNEFNSSVRAAINFLRKHRREIRRLVAFRGVDGVCLDFGLAQERAYACFNHLPADLISVAAACKIGIELSHYAISEEKRTPRPNSNSKNRPRPKAT